MHAQGCSLLEPTNVATMQAHRKAPCGDVENEWRQIFGRTPPEGLSLSNMRKCARPHEFRAAFNAMADAWGTVKRADTMRFIEAMGWTILPGFSGGSRRYLQWPEFLHVIEMNLVASEQAGFAADKSAGSTGSDQAVRRSKSVSRTMTSRTTHAKIKTRCAGNTPMFARDAVQRFECAARRGGAAAVLRAFCGGRGGIDQMRGPLITPALSQLHRLQEGMRHSALSLVRGENNGILRRALQRVTWAPGSITHFSVAQEHEHDGRLVARTLRLGILRAHHVLKRASAQKSMAQMREARAAAAEALSDAIGAHGSGASNVNCEAAWAVNSGSCGGNGLGLLHCSNSTAKNGRSGDFLFEDCDFGPALSAAGLAHTALLTAWVQGLIKGVDMEVSGQRRTSAAFTFLRVDKQLRMLRKRIDMVERRLSTLLEEKRRDGARRLARRQARLAQQQQARRAAGHGGQPNQPNFVSNTTAVTAGARGVLRLRSIEVESDSMAGALPGGASADLVAAAEEVQEQIAEEEEEARACDDLALLADPGSAAAVFRCAEAQSNSGGSRSAVGIKRGSSSSFAARDGIARGLGCGLGLPAPSELHWRRPCSFARWSVASNGAGTGDSCVPSLWGTQSKTVPQSDYTACATIESDDQADDATTEAFAARALDDDPLDPEPHSNFLYDSSYGWPGLLPPSLSNQCRLAGCNIGGGGVGPCAASPPRQGCLGDGWLLSAMAVLSKRADLLSQVCLHYSPARDADCCHEEFGSGNYVKGCGGVSGNASTDVSGYAFVRLHSGVRSHFLLIDDRFPARETAVSGTAPGSANSAGAIEVFASCVDPAHTWVAILEKAFAKLMGSYEALGTPRRAGQGLRADHGADGDEDSTKGAAVAAMSEATAWAVRCLSGLPTECFVIPRLPTQSTIDVDAANVMWNCLCTATTGPMTSKSLVYCMRATANCGAHVINPEMCDYEQSRVSSILPWHAYVLLGAAVVDDTRLVRLWNPWWLSGQSTQCASHTARNMHGESLSPSSSSPPPIAWRWDGDWSHDGKRLHDAELRQRLAHAFGAIEAFRFYGGDKHENCNSTNGDISAQINALCVCSFGAAFSDCDDGTFIMSFDEWRATFSIWNITWHMPVVREKKPETGPLLQPSALNVDENTALQGMIAYGPVPSQWQAVHLSYQQWSFEVMSSATPQPVHTLLLLHRHRRIPYAENSDVLSALGVAFVLYRVRDTDALGSIAQDGTTNGAIGAAETETSTCDANLEIATVVSPLQDELNSDSLEVVGYSKDALPRGGDNSGPSASLRVRLVPGRYIVQPIADGEVSAPLLLTACSDAGIVRPAVVSADFVVTTAAAGAMSFQSELSSLLRMADVKSNVPVSQAGGTDFVLDDAIFRLLDTSSITNRCVWMRRRSSEALINAIQRQPRLRHAEAEANVRTRTIRKSDWCGPCARSVVSPHCQSCTSDIKLTQIEAVVERGTPEMQQTLPSQQLLERIPDSDIQHKPGLHTCLRSQLREMSQEEVQQRRDDAAIVVSCDSGVDPPPAPIPEELLTLLAQHNKKRQGSKLSKIDNHAAKNIPDADDVPADVRTLLTSHARQRGSLGATVDEPVKVNAKAKVGESKTVKVCERQKYTQEASTTAVGSDMATHFVKQAARDVVEFAIANSVSDIGDRNGVPSSASDGMCRNDAHTADAACGQLSKIANSGPSMISSIPRAVARHSHQSNSIGASRSTYTRGAVIFRGGWQLQSLAQDGSVAGRRTFTLATVYEMQPAAGTDKLGFLLELVDPSCGGSTVRTVYVDELAVLLEAECTALHRAVFAAIGEAHTKSKGRVMPLADRRPSDDNRVDAKEKTGKRQYSKALLTRWPSHRQSAAAETALARWVVTAGQCVPKRRQLVEWVLARTSLVRVCNTGDEVHFLATIEPLRTAFELNSGDQVALISLATQSKRNSPDSPPADFDVDVQPLCRLVCANDA